MWKKITCLALLVAVFGILANVQRAQSKAKQVASVHTLAASLATTATDPVSDPQPASTLLPPGATTVALTVQSAVNTKCAYAVGEAKPLAAMTRFDQQTSATTHQTVVRGLNPDPNTVNEVYVRCESAPDFVLHLRYRSLSHANPTYPRTGNLWGSQPFMDKDLADAARIDLWLGAGFKPDQIRALRQLNPNIRILTSMNAIEDSALPDDYYLKDIYGQKVEVWPNFYRLNLTKAYVAEYQARRAYDLILNSDLMFDGIFFDNVMTTQAWQTKDINGNPFLVDANEDGVQDDAAVFDAAWKAGVFHEMQTFRALMPNAILTGHSLNIDEPGIAPLFNGISMGFWTAKVLEDKMLFSEAWNTYTAWHDHAQAPVTTMFEAAPLEQISYGYGYAPWDTIPPATLEFARTYYPWMRFGLALTLLNDGYFAYEYGDTWHGQDWWYDELAFDLGYPLGPAQRIEMADNTAANVIENGDFEQPLDPLWRLWVNTGSAATVTRGTGDTAARGSVAQVTISATAGTDWHVALAQYGRALQQGFPYDVTFWAKSDKPRTLTLNAQKGAPNWDNYGLNQPVTIGTSWQEYTVTFAPNATVNDARIQFLLGATTGTVWLDDVRVIRHPAEVYRREFTNGLVLLNGTRQRREIVVGPGWQRLRPTSGQPQAPLDERILDDDDPTFATTGVWTATTYDSGLWKTQGPFYHNWGKALHERAGTTGEARWNLAITAADTYTITAWWPAAPAATTWNPNVTYAVVANGQVIATQTADQRTAGDQWHFIATVPLRPEDQPYIRLQCAGSAPCVADALHIRSQQRYNDGSPATKVILQPLDGIVLQRQSPGTPAPALPYHLYLPAVLALR